MRVERGEWEIRNGLTFGLTGVPVSVFWSSRAAFGMRNRVTVLRADVGGSFGSCDGSGGGADMEGLLGSMEIWIYEMPSSSVMAHSMREEERWWYGSSSSITSGSPMPSDDGVGAAAESVDSDNSARFSTSCRDKGAGSPK